MKNTVYIKHHNSGAGKWIYEGFARAWMSLGYNIKFFDNILTVGSDAKYVMTTEADLTPDGISILGIAEKSFVFVQPFKFPNPWGKHPNWVTSVSHDIAETVNNIQSIKKWTFVNNINSKDFYPWESVHYLPLAFDSFGYQLLPFDAEKNFDVCFVGGWADNGFNEKQKRIVDFLGCLQSSDLNCGFFINSGLSHEQENVVLCTSNIAINIHDEYQVKLGLDVNERVFKSLAMSGALVSDHVHEMKNLFPKVELAESPKEMLELIKQNLENVPSLLNLKEENRALILKNHTYLSRINQMVSL